METFVTILTSTYPQDLYIVKGRLESEGIQCFLKDELTVQSNNFYSNALGGVKLQVQEEDVSRAIEILKEGGYLKDEPIRPDLLTRIDNATASIPFLNRVNVVSRVVIITLLFVMIVTIVSYLIFQPHLSPN